MKTFNNKEEKTMRKEIFAIVTILVVGSFSCSGKKEKINNMAQEKVPVIVEPVKVQKIRQVLHFTGDIKGIEEIDVYPKVQGKLIENKVKEGSIVKKDGVIALVDRDISGMKYEPFEVISPISGLVAKVFLDNGAVVVPPTMSTTMGTPIARIVNMERAKLIVNVGDRDYPLVRPGQIAEIIADAYPERLFLGKVNAISPVINPYTKTAAVEIIIPNEKLLLRSGMFAEVKIITEEREGIVIASDYILNTDGNSYVYVIHNNIAEKRIIKTGIVEENKVEVLDGLKEGESVVTVGAEMLTDGTMVEIGNGGQK